MMKNSSTSKFKYLSTISGFKPDAYAYLKGAPNYSRINGLVNFYETDMGVIVTADVTGLPTVGTCGFFAFHIHEGNRCTGNSSDPFADAGGHYNPTGAQHPCHAGDMPPLLSNNGCALCAFLTDRFTVDEIIGHTVIVHLHSDDFTTQPSGNSGEKIACGTIIAY